MAKAKKKKYSASDKAILGIGYVLLGAFVLSILVPLLYVVIASFMDPNVLNSQGISFELQARPAPEVVETQLTIDGQKLRYINQMVDWQTFRWPGETYKPGTLLTWTTVNAGTRLFGDYSGTWGFIRWLEQGKRQQLERSQWMMSFTAPDGRTLQWVLRSQLGSGPLVLLALRGLTLPDQIFTVDAAESAQALTTGVGNSDMDEMEL